MTMTRGRAPSPRILAISLLAAVAGFGCGYLLTGEGDASEAAAVTALPALAPSTARPAIDVAIDTGAMPALAPPAARPTTSAGVPSAPTVSVRDPAPSTAVQRRPPTEKRQPTTPARPPVEPRDDPR